MNLARVTNGQRECPYILGILVLVGGLDSPAPGHMKRSLVLNRVEAGVLINSMSIWDSGGRSVRSVAAIAFFCAPPAFITEGVLDVDELQPIVFIFKLKINSCHLIFLFLV